MAANNILSRGKALDDGKWYIGWYCRYPFGRWPLKDAIIPADDAEDGYHHFEEVDGATVGRFTGLMDVNDVRIFDGDIVSNAEYDFPLVVKWDNGGFYLTAKKTFYSFLDYYSAGFCTVIGNIYDNPEMVEGKESK